jgi:symplekin
VEWLNEASISSNETVKVQNLCKTQEILLNKEPLLLNMYLDEMLQFAIDRNAEVRKTIAGFIEDVGYIIIFKIKIQLCKKL